MKTVINMGNLFTKKKRMKKQIICINSWHVSEELPREAQMQRESETRRKVTANRNQGSEIKEAKGRDSAPFIMLLCYCECH